MSGDAPWQSSHFAERALDYTLVSVTDERVLDAALREMGAALAPPGAHDRLVVSWCRLDQACFRRILHALELYPFIRQLEVDASCVLVEPRVRPDVRRAPAEPSGRPLGAAAQRALCTVEFGTQPPAAFVDAALDAVHVRGAAIVVHVRGALDVVTLAHHFRRRAAAACVKFVLPAELAAKPADVTLALALLQAVCPHAVVGDAGRSLCVGQ